MSDLMLGKIATAVQTIDEIDESYARAAAGEKRLPEELLAAVRTRSMKNGDPSCQKVMARFLVMIAKRESELYELLEVSDEDKFHPNMKEVFTSILLFNGVTEEDQRAERTYEFWMQLSPTEVYSIYIDVMNFTIEVERVQRKSRD